MVNSHWIYMEDDEPPASDDQDSVRSGGRNGEFPRTASLSFHPMMAKMGMMNRHDPKNPVNAAGDVKFMRRALAEAKKAQTKGEVPVGTVVVRDGQIIGRGGNSPIRLRDATAHSEIIALRKACRKLGNYRLADCDLYVTLEPCPMCLGAIIHARVRRLVYGARDPKCGAVESPLAFSLEKTNHRLDIRGGVLSQECAGILKKFFRVKRRTSSKTR